MTSELRIEWLEAIPRHALALLPTPLNEAPRLAGKAGLRSLYVKRDDCTGLAGGGNKTRKLEYLIQAAQDAQASAIVTFGALQSNHARQTAAACAHAGITCHLILSDQVPLDDEAYRTNGNVLLDHLLGAHLYVVRPENVHAAYLDLRRRLQRQGETVFEIPPGGSNAIGALGYVRCAVELANQALQAGFNPDLVVTGASSAGTLAGLISGFTALATRDARYRNTRIVGVNVYHSDINTLTVRTNELLRDIDALSTNPGAPTIPWSLWDGVGEGYGLPDARVRQALELAAQSEGLLLDPAYSGKALAQLLERVPECTDDNVIFVHTGGVPSISAYAQMLSSSTD